MTNENNSSDGITRRKFIQNAGIAAGAGMVLSMPLAASAVGFLKTDGPMTVKQIMDKFIAEVGAGNIPNTVDTLKSGSPDTVVTGVLTTMFATIDMIRKAIDLGANFIIAHEPTFYNHQDDTGWLKNDDVYRYKADLLKEHNIAIWRNHDYIHTHKPDGVTKAQLEQLAWKQYSDKEIPNILTMPAAPLQDIVKHVKQKLNIDMVRYVGDPEQICKRVLYMPGAAGGMRQIQSIEKVKPDAVFCGEISEWETAEYVRDARAKGDNLSLVVMGHIASEEWGSQFMLEWLNKNFPNIKATHISPGNSLKFM
ncbi:MAG: Nif3-like dinuclear metal center hexameric protein [Bacteroidetes bacterium]|nr:Nif3-like dinuclear metal center hexameric protein [Bacteroidota bacterium]